MTRMPYGSAPQVETIADVQEMGKVVEEMTAAAMGAGGDENGIATPMDAE